MSKTVIDCFDGEYGFLSNFHECTIKYNGITYRSSEAAFQAQKTTDKHDRYEISKMKPGQSKRACSKNGIKGFKITLREDWDKIKDDVMYKVVLAKFTQNKHLKNMLLNTGDAELIEGTKWHDNYWGNCTCMMCSMIEGKNTLGKILMRVREELRS